MENFKERWWRIGAGIIAIAVAFFGMGNLFEEDGGPLSGKIVAASIAVVIAGMLMAGLVIRRTNTARGSYMIAIGALPVTDSDVVGLVPAGCRYRASVDLRCLECIQGWPQTSEL